MRNKESTLRLLTIFAKSDSENIIALFAKGLTSLKHLKTDMGPLIKKHSDLISLS